MTSTTSPTCTAIRRTQKLVLYIGGNQFFVMPRLIAGFTKQFPELAGHIFYETLPSGILRKQMDANNTITLGNLTLHAVPDVYGPAPMCSTTCVNTTRSTTSFATPPTHCRSWLPPAIREATLPG